MTTPEIPNRFDYQTTCQEIYQAWEAAGCFDANVDSARQPFSIVIPPPNVTGALHLGHALNNTLQDIQIRWHRMRGYEALWMPGTDHAGIATQAVVERRLKELENKTRHDVGRQGLIERIWQWKDQYEARIINQLKRLGSSCDWRRTRFTLDAMCAKAVRATFFDLYAKKLIYRGKRLVNWDTFLQTAVSDDELFHETVKGHFWHIRYPVIQPRPGEPRFVTIATTRPETMLGDTAVAVHPDPAAAFDSAEKALRDRVSAASAKDRELLQKQLDDLLECKQSSLQALVKLRDMALRGTRLKLPLVDRVIPLIADPWAKPEMGTGCVKITPAHDPNDYEVGLRCSLPMINIMLPDGKLNAAAGKYAGLSVSKARQQVVDDLEKLGLLESVEDREIDLAHSDRSKTAIEPLLADQWFVKMDQLAQNAIDAVTSGQIEIIPQRYAKGYIDWLSEKRDWPVGRQLWWGHQIPIWSKNFSTADETNTEAAWMAGRPEMAVGRMAIQLEGTCLLHVCIRDDGDELEKLVESRGFARQEDVLDTWFSSALWPHSTLGWPEKSKELDYFYPTSVLITSRDIITLWVARMVLMGLNNVGKIPFHKVYIHPKILDGFGETMSKSKGNGVDPIDVIDKFGPDALRFGLAWLATETQDVRMPVQFECPRCQALTNQTKQNRTQPSIACSNCNERFSTQWAESEIDQALPRAAVVSERFESARNFCNKLWNAARFVMLNLDGFAPTKLDPHTQPLEDRWILSRLATTTQAVSEANANFHFADAARAVYDFAWDEFCSYYVEMAKPRLQDPATRAATQQVLAHTLDHLLRLLHPIMPFITEAIWQQLAHFSVRRTLDDAQPGLESEPLSLASGESDARNAAATPATTTPEASAYGSQTPEASAYGSQETRLASDRARPATKWLIETAWPQARLQDRDARIEEQFAKFVSVLGALREIRSRQNIPPKAELTFYVGCDPATQALLEPMDKFFKSLAGASAAGYGADFQVPEMVAKISVDSLEVSVDLGKFIDVPAEIDRNEKLLENIVKQIAGKQSKLSNANFVQRAPSDVVAKERESLTELEQQRESVEQALSKLRAAK